MERLTKVRDDVARDSDAQIELSKLENSMEEAE